MTLTLFDKFIMSNDFDKMNQQQKDEVAAHIARQKGISMRNMPDQTILDYHKEIKSIALNEICESTIENGFESEVNGHHYRTNKDDQINFIGQCQLLFLEPSIETIIWKTEDAGPISITRKEFMGIYKEGLLHKNNTIQKYWQKKMAVSACSTHAEIIAIDWNSIETPSVVEEPVKEEPVKETPIPPQEPAEEEIVEEEMEIEEPVEEGPWQYEQDPGEGEYEEEEPEEELTTFSTKEEEKPSGLGKLFGLFKQ